MTTATDTRTRFNRLIANLVEAGFLPGAMDYARLAELNGIVTAHAEAAAAGTPPPNSPQG